MHFCISRFLDFCVLRITTRVFGISNAAFLTLYFYFAFLYFSISRFLRFKNNDKSFWNFKCRVFNTIFLLCIFVLLYFSIFAFYYFSISEFFNFSISLFLYFRFLFFVFSLLSSLPWITVRNFEKGGIIYKCTFFFFLFYRLLRLSLLSQ